MALLREGVPPALIDKAGLMAGMPVGPLALADEVSIELVHKIAQQTGPTSAAPMSSARGSRRGEDGGRTRAAGTQVGRGLLRLSGGGQKHLWPGLARRISRRSRRWMVTRRFRRVEQIIERLILVQSVETARCLEEKVLRAPIDADVGAILGWGYPPSVAGRIGWLHTLGLPAAVAALDRLAEGGMARASPRRNCCATWRRMGERFRRWRHGDLPRLQLPECCPRGRLGVTRAFQNTMK
jgi:3-hydroxyacyl-CoA dehydrogenase/enoyl-CoA hydratase/3-hydroxybutyryl-CoA epimerase